MYDAVDSIQHYITRKLEENIVTETFDVPNTDNPDTCTPEKTEDNVYLQVFS